MRRPAPTWAASRSPPWHGGPAAVRSTRSSRSGSDGLGRLIESFLDVGFSKFVLRPLSPPVDWRSELEALAAGVGGMQT